MLSEALGTAFKSTPLDIINGTYRVDISAGTKLAARNAIDKYMTVLTTFLQSPGTVENLAVQAMKIDYNAMFSALYDTFNVPYKEKIIVAMNDDDKQRMFNDTAAAAAQSKQGLIKTQGEVKKDVDNNQAENRMLIETGKHTLNHASGEVDQNHALELQREKMQAQTPQAQGFDRAAKGAFATLDKPAFGQ